MSKVENSPEIRFNGFDEEWKIKLLGDIATMKARIGWQGLTQKEFLDKGDFYLITGTDFINGTINFGKCHHISKYRYDQDINIQINNDDVLITKDGTIGKVAYVNNMNKPATLNAGVFVVRGINEETRNLYLYHYLAAPYLLDYAAKTVTGGTIKHLNQCVLVKFPVPLPQSGEQQKIGTYFKQIDQLITLKQKKHTKLLNLKKAMLNKMFPQNGASIPEIRFKGFEGEWEEKSFKNVIEKIQTGTNLLGKIENLGTPLLKMGNIQRGYFSLDKLEYIDKSIAVEKENMAYYGDFLFNTRNTLELVGKGATWIGDNNKFAFNGNLARFTFKGIDTIFFNYLYNTNNVVNQVRARAMGTTSVAAIYPKNLDSIEFRVPSKGEQQKIGNYFKKLDHLINLQEKEIAKLQHIKKALLEKMFV